MIDLPCNDCPFKYICKYFDSNVEVHKSIELMAKSSPLDMGVFITCKLESWGNSQETRPPVPDMLNHSEVKFIASHYDSEEEEEHVDELYNSLKF